MGHVGVATNITSFMEKAVKMWNTTLTINGETIGEVKIKRGIFKEIHYHHSCLLYP